MGSFLLLPSLSFYYFIRHGISDKVTVVSCVLYAMALALYFLGSLVERASQTLVVKLRSAGILSYGLYLVRFPLLHLFRLLPAYEGTISTYLARYLVYLLVPVAAAYFLEKKYQPWAKAQFGS